MTFDNDGIATTIAMASAYASDTLRIGAFPIALTFLITLVIAFFGSIAFGRLMAVDVDEARASRLRWDFEGAEVDVVS